MKVLLKYGIPPLIPLFIIICLFIISAKYFPIFNGKSLFEYFPRLPENHISKFVETGVVDVIGIIASKPEELDKRLRFDLVVQKLTDIERVNKINRFPFNDYLGMIQVNIYNSLTQYKQGDIIQFKGEIKPFRNFNNPGSFDYVSYMKNKDLWGKISVNGKKINIIGDTENIKKLSSNTLPKHNIDNFEPANNSVSSHSFNLHDFSYYKLVIDKFRENFTNHILENSDDKDSAAILSALTIGNTELISKELNRDFSKTGVSHILSVSGLHLSIVAGLFFYLFNLLLSCSYWVLIRGLSKKTASLLTLFPIIAYSIISGNSDATQRSMIMIIIFMLAYVIERESDMFNSLAAAGIVILIFEPLSLFSISFQLSFAALFFILMGLSLANQYEVYIKKNLENRENLLTMLIRKSIASSFVKKFINFIFVSVCATAGTQLLVMHYFNLFSFSGVFTNLVVIPLIGIAALYLGFAALFSYPFSVAASGFFIKCAGFILNLSIGFIKQVAALPFSYIETFTPDTIEITCYYIFMSALFVAAKFRRNGEIDYNPNNYIFFRYGIVAAVLSFFVIVIHEGFWINKRFFNDKLLITLLDVGQGNSALIEMPKGKTILVDGGGFSYIGKFDTGENIIAPFLRQKKIKTLDVVILTHSDSDHLNGLIYILDHFNVKTFIKNCDEKDNIAYKNLIEAIQKNSSRLFVVDKVEPITIKIGEGELKFFHPLKPCKNRDVNFLDKKWLAQSKLDSTEPYFNEKEDKNINDNSLVFKVIFKDNSILFTGDITSTTENEIISKYKIDDQDINRDLKSSNLKSDILIAPHHGSSGSSSDCFLDNVAPENIIISCGWQNRFGFPKSIVLNRYKERGINVFRTDLNGAVMLYSDGTKWKINSFL
ncbi:MAG: DNA internalization-related competence protein ComEC/Rec2 [Desulfamplus sp.]|nr:DNA internalization-related competence protein ComEC/Rec2 [Desulfamplus sp.]